MTIPTKREYPHGLSAADAIRHGFPPGTKALYRLTGTHDVVLWSEGLWFCPQSGATFLGTGYGPLTITEIPGLCSECIIRPAAKTSRLGKLCIQCDDAKQPAKPLRYDGDLVAADCIAAGMPVGTRVRPWANESHVWELRQDGWYWLNPDGTLYDTQPHGTLYTSTATGPEPAAEPERDEPELSIPVQHFARFETGVRTLLKRIESDYAALKSEVRDCRAEIRQVDNASDKFIDSVSKRVDALERWTARRTEDRSAFKEPLCGRCGHPMDWHRQDDGDEMERCRCLGYDCEAAGPPPPTGRACGCPSFVDAPPDSIPVEGLRERLEGIETDWLSERDDVSLTEFFYRALTGRE